MQTSLEQTTPKQSDSQTPPIAIFKLVIVGDSGVGKSTFIKQFSTGILEELETNDQKITVHKTRFATTIGDIQFNVWDLNAASLDVEPPEEFLAGADCAILMFDTTSRLSYKDVPAWFKKIQLINENMRKPTILTGNKVDLKDRKVKIRQITFHRKRNIGYNDVSAGANYEVEKPFIYLMRALTNDMTLNLVESPVVQPPSVMMDQDQLEKLEAERRAFEAQSLPDDDDEYM